MRTCRSSARAGCSITSQQGVAEPLDCYVTPEFKGRFIETFLTPSVMDGKVYGLPIAASARAMYYNKDVFAKAGINEPPATWADLKTAAEKIKARRRRRLPFGLQGKEIETDVYFYYGMWSYGGEIVKDGKSGLDQQGRDRRGQALQGLHRSGLTQPGVTSNSREDVQNLFKQGKVAHGHHRAVPRPTRSRTRRRSSNTAWRRSRPGRAATAAPMA